MQDISVRRTLLKRMGCDVSRPALVAPARRVFQVLENHLTTSQIHVGNQVRYITLLSHEWSIESKALRTSIHAILRLRLCQWQSWVGHHAINKTILIENDPLGDWSLEKNWCWRPTFQQLCGRHLQSQDYRWSYYIQLLPLFVDPWSTQSHLVCVYLLDRVHLPQTTCR